MSYYWLPSQTHAFYMTHLVSEIMISLDTLSVICKRHPNSFYMFSLGLEESFLPCACWIALFVYISCLFDDYISVTVIFWSQSGFSLILLICVIFSRMNDFKHIWPIAPHFILTLLAHFILTVLTEGAWHLFLVAPGYTMIFLLVAIVSTNCPGWDVMYPTCKEGTRQ